MKKTSKTSAGRQIKLSDDVLFRQLDKDDGILLNIKTKNYYSLNETACFLIRSIVKGATKDSIVNSFTKRYQTTKKKVCKDIESLLSILKRDEIVKKY